MFRIIGLCTRQLHRKAQRETLHCAREDRQLQFERWCMIDVLIVCCSTPPIKSGIWRAMRNDINTSQVSSETKNNNLTKQTLDSSRLRYENFIHSVPFMRQPSLKAADENWFSGSYPPSVSRKQSKKITSISDTKLPARSMGILKTVRRQFEALRRIVCYNPVIPTAENERQIHPTYAINTIYTIVFSETL